jgi:hypothetical protein
METVTIEIKSSKAMKLLKDLESLDIIKIHQSAQKPATKDKASKYRGSISPGNADQLMAHLQEIRNEWDERFPTI